MSWNVFGIVFYVISLCIGIVLHLELVDLRKISFAWVFRSKDKPTEDNGSQHDH